MNALLLGLLIFGLFGFGKLNFFNTLQLLLNDSTLKGRVEYIRTYLLLTLYNITHPIDRLFLKNCKSILIFKVFDKNPKTE